MSTRRSMSKGGAETDYLLHFLRSPTKSTSSVSASRLRSDSSSWERASGTQKNKLTAREGTLSNQPQLTRVTPTALLVSWVLQPIEGVTSLGTDFEKCAIWQGSVEEPAAKDFCSKEGLHYQMEQSARNHLERNQVQRAPEKLSSSCRQTSNNQPYSQVQKSLWDFFPGLYCVDLAKAYVMQESVSLRI